MLEAIKIQPQEHLLQGFLLCNAPCFALDRDRNSSSHFSTSSQHHATSSCARRVGMHSLTCSYVLSLCWVLLCTGCCYCCCRSYSHCICGFCIVTDMIEAAVAYRQSVWGQLEAPSHPLPGAQQQQCGSLAVRAALVLHLPPGCAFRCSACCTGAVSAGPAHRAGN